MRSLRRHSQPVACDSITLDFSAAGKPPDSVYLEVFSLSNARVLAHKYLPMSRRNFQRRLTSATSSDDPGQLSGMSNHRSCALPVACVAVPQTCGFTLEHQWEQRQSFGHRAAIVRFSCKPPLTRFQTFSFARLFAP